VGPSSLEMPTVSRRYGRLDEDDREVQNSASQWDDEPGWTRIAGLPVTYNYSDDEVPARADRWTTWDDSLASERGPAPYPDWLVTELGAVDYELGVLKTGKEADVHLIRREVPDTDRSCLLAAKRYRDERHRQFQRSAVYQEGRRTRKTRDARAIRNRSTYGRQLIAGHWARAEFDALTMLCQLGAAAPYPAQIVGTELLMEFIGDEDGTPAPRLTEISTRGARLADLWEQAVELMVGLAAAGYAHGDLSEFNLLVHGERLVVIDLPQLVDVVANPQGPTFLDRDATTVARWFARRDFPVDTGELISALHRAARIG
jgi:RIO kinase 1